MSTSCVLARLYDNKTWHKARFALGVRWPRVAVITEDHMLSHRSRPVRRAAIGKWAHVMKLEEAPLRAATVGPNKRAPAFVACPDSAFDCGWDAA